MKRFWLYALVITALIMCLSPAASAAELDLGALDSLLGSLQDEAPEGSKAASLASLTGGADPVTIGVIAERLPATSVGEDGVPDGYDTRLVSAILKKANYENLSYRAIAEADAEKLLASGEITCAIGYTGDGEGLISSKAYQPQKAVTLKTGEKTTVGGAGCCLTGLSGSKKIIDAFDLAMERVDISGAKDELFAEYFQTGALFGFTSAIRRWTANVAREFRINLIDEARYRMIFTGLGRTLLIAVSAALIGVILGCCVALMRLSKIRIGSWYAFQSISSLYVDVIRGTPVVVQLMIMYYIILNSPDISKIMVAIITFGLNSAAYVSEMVRGGILAVDKGQTEAGRSLGLSSGATMMLIVLPQTIKIIIPSLFNEIIMLLKETSVVGFIGLMDLTKAGDYIRSRTYSAFFPLLTVAAVYLIIVTTLTRVFNRVERRMRQSDIR